MLKPKISIERLRALPPAEQAAALALLQEYEAQRIRNPLEAYIPASCQREHPGLPPGAACNERCHHASFHLATEPMRAFFGGNRAGKTTTCLVDDLIQMTPHELLPEYLHPYKTWECPFYCRVMTPDMNRTMRPVIHQKLREWTPRDLLKGGNFDRSYDKSSESLRLECGCRFDFLSYEMDLDKFGGAALHRCHYDEEPPASIRKECLMRLIDYNGEEVLSMTPLKGLTWTFREVWKKEDPNIFKIKIGIHDNPTLSAAARDRVLGSISDEKERAAREFGDFMHESGLVYPMWRQALVPMKRRGDLGDDLVVSIDPGIRFAGITFTAFDQREISHTFAALKLTDATANDYARAIAKVLLDWGYRHEDVNFTGDPNATARNAANGRTVADELADVGIFMSKGNNSVEAGVKQIRRRILHGACEIADTVLTEDLRDELEQYVLDIDPDADDGEFKVAKLNDHVADAWRYGHMERPWEPEVARQAESSGAWWEIAGPPQKKAPHVSVMGAMT